MRSFQQRIRDHGLTGIFDLAQQFRFKLMRHRHFACSHFVLACAMEAQLAVSKRALTFVGFSQSRVHPHRRTEDPTGHRPPCVDIAATGGFIERRTRRIVSEVFKAFQFSLAFAQPAGRSIARKFLAVCLYPSPGAPLDLRCLRRIYGAQANHSRPQPRSVERIDRECAKTALRASQPAHQPIAGPPRCLGQSRIDDLYQFRVSCRKPHAAKLIATARVPAQSRLFEPSESCYNQLEGHVIYIEHIPAAPLNCCIRSLWYARVNSASHSRERILPTGRVQIILNLARDFLLDCPDGQPAQPTAPALVVGARSRYEMVDTADMADLIGVVFHPGGFAPFARDSVDLFSNRSVGLDDLWGGAAEPLRDRLRELATPPERLQCLEGFLRQSFSTQLARHRVIDFALDRFQRAPGAATVHDVAKSAGWSERRFSQVFREQVGFSPKAWTRILRFQRAVQLLHAGADVPWAEMALDCGYYDQSHFANEFRAFSGIDATTYVARRTVWANHVPANECPVSKLPVNP